MLGDVHEYLGISLNSEKKNPLIQAVLSVRNGKQGLMRNFQWKTIRGARPSSGLFHKGSNLSSALLCGLRKSRLAISLNLDLNGLFRDV